MSPRTSSSFLLNIACIAILMGIAACSAGVYISSMRIVLQKVSQASVSVDGVVTGAISQGYVLLLGVMKGDTEAQAQWLASKIVKLRLFDGQNGNVNDRTVLDISGEILVVSQFTLAGDVSKGNRPDYTSAEIPHTAEVLYERFQEYLQAEGVGHVASGRFGAHMEVTLQNDGPVTILLEK